jgi:hypothetical protein
MAVGALGILGVVDPEQSAFTLRCPWLMLTGLYCPGCGTLRAMHRLLTGDPAAMLRLNLLVVAVLLAAPLGMLRPQLLRSPAISRGIVAVILAFWVLRNVPFAPFTRLAPAERQAPFFERLAAR